MKKIVYENLNEMNFQKKMDNPLVALGIGKIQLIKDWLDEMGVDHYKINDDYTIDVNTDGVFLSHKGLKEFPDYIKFNKVKTFDIDDNQFISLRGCPEYVSGSFYCSFNELTSLEGCPKKVGVEFGCISNKKYFSKEYVMSLCDVRFNNIYNIIKNNII